ncbi:hypothetical protein HF086_009838 [Spodoptera exigua]|uniref:Uncharacterized protein n=1 Tax=Spodoptera exigua TaxID=7107 RepID=A0A922MX80_SPOEX|nr:hypothetical protein HF086_009838 [Spodoptera exigua]
MSKYHAKCTDSKHKRTPPQPAPTPERAKPDPTDLLTLINPNRVCSCEVVARAVSDDIPKLIGMQHLHDSQKTDDDLAVVDPNAPAKSKPLCKKSK